MLEEAYPAAAEVLVAMGAKALPRGPGDDPELDVRRAIVTSLAVVQQPAGLEYLVGRLEEDYDEGIRNAAVQTLGRIGDPRAIGILREVFATDNEKNKAWAVEALGLIGSEDGLDVVLEAMNDYDGVTRGKAAFALYQIKGDGARAELEAALAKEIDDMPAIRIAYVLTKMGDTGGLELIENRVRYSENNFARAEAARVLGEVGRAESIAVLDWVFHNDRDGLVKKEVSTSIRTLIDRFPASAGKPQS